MTVISKCERFVQALLCGLVLWLPLLVVGAFAWTGFAPERLYHCWDDVPLLTFIPPFVHPWANNGQLLDFYIWPPWAVYSLWFGVIGLSLFVPALFGWLVFRPQPFEEDAI